ncbi:MAG: 1-deoxy-D-xylulose-5-phosphate synthase [Candidatus Sumerlaeota bacterium]|nr:1-deoxy-D-xylulose-5-phosphate synthase [Candidatus Sumerlaeota bacterium]
MRAAFFNTLAELAETDSRILLLTSDLGYMAVEPFSRKFPRRFFNVGIAEQNMIGLATGLAEAGFLPFVYSIVPFAVLRPYEFIRNGPVYHRLPVRIVGIGGGLEYANDGITHYGIEDVGVLRIQPNLTLVIPADSEQARAALRSTWNLPGPIYYRLGKDDKTLVPGLNGRFELGRAQWIAEGKDILMIAMGSITAEAVRAAEALKKDGVSCAVMTLSSMNPDPGDDLKAALERYPIALTVEAHYIKGGLGSLVSEIVAQYGLPCRIVRCGIQRMPDGHTGSQAALYRNHGISSDALARAVLQALGRAAA